MFEDGAVCDHLDQLHHPAVFMRQDVAMVHVRPDEIVEAAAHYAMARHEDLLAVGTQARCPVGISTGSRRNPEGVPPYVRRPHRFRTGHRARVKHFDDLKWIDVYVEGVRDADGAVVDGPLFGAVEKHHFVDDLVLELLAVDHVPRPASRGFSPTRSTAVSTLGAAPTIIHGPLDANEARVDVGQSV